MCTVQNYPAYATRANNLEQLVELNCCFDDQKPVESLICLQKWATRWIENIGQFKTLTSSQVSTLQAVFRATLAHYQRELNNLLTHPSRIANALFLEFSANLASSIYEGHLKCCALVADWLASQHIVGLTVTPVQSGNNQFVTC